jgi:hypothetical protein
MVLKLCDDLKVAFKERDALRSRVEQLERELGECSGAFEMGTKAIEENARLMALARFGRWCLSEYLSGLALSDVDCDAAWNRAKELGLIDQDYFVTDLAKLPEEE